MPPRVLRSIEEVRALGVRNSAVTLGVFDGVHLGHRRIIGELLRARAHRQVGACYLITFDPHPVVVTHSRMTPPMLTTIEERVHLLGAFELDGIVVLTFDKQLAGVDYRTFLDRYLIGSFDMKRFVMGYDCYFGKDRQGSPERVLREARALGFEATVVPAERVGDEVVSSTKIRNALMEGDLGRANRLLGHPYLVAGTVVHGHGKGRDLGFRTANLSVRDPMKLWPPRGVYAVRAERRGETFDGMMNVGRAPTMKALSSEAAEIEIHLFDFDEDLYGESLRVYCHAFLREERKFPSPEALARQLEADRTRAREALGRDRENRAPGTR